MLRKGEGRGRIEEGRGEEDVFFDITKALKRLKEVSLLET